MTADGPRARPNARAGSAAPGLGRRARQAVVAAAAGAALLPLLAWPAVGQGNEDPRDQPYATAIVNQALETERTNVEVPWSNPETGHRGTVVILRTYYRDGGQTPCRDYVRTLERPGAAPVVTEGTGCRVGRARWQLDERTVREATAPEPRPLGPPPAAGPAAPEEPPPEAETVEREEPAPPAATAAACPEPAAAPKAKAGADTVASSEEAPAFPTFTMPSKAEL